LIASKNLTISSKTLVLILIGVLLILVAGLRPTGIDGDSLNYIGVLHVSLSEANFIDKEPCFWIINELNKILFAGNDQTFFLIFAIIGVTLKVLAIQKLSLLPIFSIFTYLCLYFILHEMTQIRAGVAAAIFLLAIPNIYNRNFKAFLLKTILAMMFHYSAILMLLVYFLNPYKINLKVFFFLPLIGIIFMLIGINVITILNPFLFILPDFIANKIELYILLLDDEKFNQINVFNFYYASLLVFYYIMILHHNYFKSLYDVLFLKIFGLMLFFFYFSSAIPVLAFRVSEFFGVVLIILIPHFALIFKQKTIAKIPLILWLTIYLIFIMVFQNLNF
jgi:hypothetical protein